MQNLINRLDSLEKTARFRERPVLEWATADLCRLLAESTPKQLSKWSQNRATPNSLIEAIREHVPNYALGATHSKQLEKNCRHEESS